MSTTEPTTYTIKGESQVSLVSHVGGDDSVVKSMLVSTLGTRSLDATATSGRIGYLMKNRHGSPFEHNQFTFLIYAPWTVIHQIQRHRTWSFNEESGRYREFEPAFYSPPADRPLEQVGKAGEYRYITGPEHLRDEVTRTLAMAYSDAWARYEYLIRAGVAREVARLVLPVGTFTSAYATCNARALMTFLSVRVHEEDSTVRSFPQWETEQVARMMEGHFAIHMPLTYQAFVHNGRVAP